MVKHQKWIEINIRQNPGQLGAVYPLPAMSVNGLKQGDSRSFMYLVSAIVKKISHEDPTQDNWGGQFVRLSKTNHWVDGVGVSSISKWKGDYQADFVKREDWMIP